MRGVEAVFLRCGFVMGDFPTLVFTRLFAALDFLDFLAKSPTAGVDAAGGLASRSMPSGELVVVPALSARSSIVIGSD